MSFKDQIREQYHREVQPEFQEKYWDAYLTYRDKKKPRRRFLFLLLFGLLIPVMAFFIHRYPKVNLVTVDQAGVDQPLPSEMEELLGVMPLQGSVSAEVDDSSNKVLGEFTEAPTVSSQSALDRSQLKHQLSFDERRSNINQVSHVASLQPKKELIEAFDSALVFEEYQSPGESLNPVGSRSMIDFIVLPTKFAPLAQNRNEQLILSPIEIPIRVNPLWKSSRNGAYLYGGLAFPFHVQTIEEQAHQFGGKFYRNLSRRFRAKAGLEFSVISFISKVMDPQLGVAVLESPSEFVQFRAAVVESVNTNLEVGGDFMLFDINACQGYLGLSYGISTELFKEIEYSFDGDNNINTDDDIILAITNPERYFVPHILKIESGFQYQTRLGGFNLSFAYPYQLSKNKLELLGQLQINFGFTKAF